MTTSAQSRYQILNTPVLAPGVCFTCGASDSEHGRVYIDFGKQIDWYGAVYLCSECIREVAEAIGFIPVDKFNNLYDDNKKLQILVDQANKSLENIRNVYADLFAGRVDVPSSFDDVSSTDSTDATTVDEILRIDVSGDSDAEQTTSEQGSGDFFDIEDFDDGSESRTNSES